MEKYKYQEIFKLKEMLENADIPFDWVENFGYDDAIVKNLKRIAPDLMHHYHITYPCFGDGRWISVVEGFGMYGSEQDLLEVMWNDGEVEGWLDAKTIFEKIKTNWEEIKTMKRKIKRIDPDTFEITEVLIDVEEVEDEAVGDAIVDFADALRNAMACTPDEFYEKYKKMKDAEAEFKEVYEPLKAEVIKLHETSNLPKNVIVGGAKLTYVSPSTRSSIDSKKLKEEEPEIAKKFTKTSQVAATVRIESI